MCRFIKKVVTFIIIFFSFTFIIYASFHFYKSHQYNLLIKKSNNDLELLNNLEEEIDIWGRDFFKKNLDIEYTGNETIKVAVLDSGINKEHEDLKHVVIKQYNAITPTEPVIDTYNHGTAIAGIIASTDNDIGIRGMSQNVEIVDIKVINDIGKVSIESVLEGLTYAINEDVDIINMSFGFAQSNKKLEELIKKANEKEIVLISAAGNNFGTEADFPARYSQVLSIGSIGKDGTITSQSAKGKIDFLAPGEEILSTDASGDYSLYNGTSISVAFITGLVAEGILQEKIQKTTNVAELTEVITNYILN